MHLNYMCMRHSKLCKYIRETHLKKKTHLTTSLFLLKPIWAGRVKKKQWRVRIIIHKIERIPGQL